MANPQVENGHTQIANEILEQLAYIHLKPNHWQVLLCIIRKTYGFKRKVDYIANCQIVQGTGLSKEVVSRSLRELTDRNIISRKGKFIGFQKDYEDWKLTKSSTKVTQTANFVPKVDQIVNSEKLAKSSTQLAKSSTQLAKSSTKVDCPVVTQKKKESIQKKVSKRKYGEFENVLLSDKEYQKLVDRFGESKAKDRIEILSSGIESKGYKYDSHYATILNWARRDEKGGQGGSSKGNIGKLPETYETPEEYARRHS